MRRWGSIVGSAVLLVALVLAAACVAQQGTTASPPPEESAVEARLVAMAKRLELARTFATLAVLSPTVGDQHLHAQRVVNLLEGTGGEHFVERFSPEGKVVGLLPEARAIAFLLSHLPPEKERREEAVLAAKEIVQFLDLALGEGLAALRSRRPEAVSLSMLKAYAFVSAALGREDDPPSLGGVLALLRSLPRPS